MTVQSWVAGVNSPSAFPIAGTAYASSTSATDVNPGAALACLLPPNTLSMYGLRIKVVGGGVFSNTGTPNLTLGVYWGGVAGVALGATAATATASGVTNVPWEIEYEGVVRTTGATGTIQCVVGHVRLGTSTTAMSLVPFATRQSPVTCDTTTQKAVTIGATWGTNSASNTLTCHDIEVTIR